MTARVIAAGIAGSVSMVVSPAPAEWIVSNASARRGRHDTVSFFEIQLREIREHCVEQFLIAGHPTVDARDENRSPGC